MEGMITGYTWEVWYNGSCLHENDTVFETEDEAEDEAVEFCEERLEQWKFDGAELDGTELEELKNGIVINDVVED